MQLAIIENHNSHGRYYMTMSKDKQNNGEKEILAAVTVARQNKERTSILQGMEPIVNDIYCFLLTQITMNYPLIGCA